MNDKRCERCGHKIPHSQKFCQPCSEKLGYNEVTKRFYKKDERV